MNAFTILFRSVALLFRNKKLIGYALLPWMVNVIVFIFSMSVFIWLDRKLMVHLEAFLGEHWWTPVISWTLGVVLVLAFGAGFILCFIYLVQLVAGVFAEQLSMHVEAILTGRMVASPEGSFFRVWMRSIVEELKGIAFFLTVWLALLPLNLISGIGNAMFMVLSWIWTAISLAFEFTAPAAERHGMRFAEKKKLIFGRLHRSGSLGFVIMLLTWIPILNLFFYPFAVIAGTIWMVENRFLPESVDKQ